MIEPAARWDYLRTARIKAGLTQVGLAKAVGKSNTHISYLEAGLRRPGPGLYTQLAAALDVPIEDLISSTPVPPPRVVVGVAA